MELQKRLWTTKELTAECHSAKCGVNAAILSHCSVRMRIEDKPRSARADDNSGERNRVSKYFPAGGPGENNGNEITSKKCTRVRGGFCKRVRTPRSVEVDPKRWTLPKEISSWWMRRDVLVIAASGNTKTLSRLSLYFQTP